MIRERGISSFARTGSPSVKAALAALDRYTDVLADISPAMGRGHSRIAGELASLLNGKETE